MSRSIKNALISMVVLAAITVVCVGLLAVCNMFFPKYTPVLDAVTARLINGICDTGKTDTEAFDGGYIVMLRESDYKLALADYNKRNRSKRAEVLAVYGEPKGINAGAYIVESKSAGRDGDIVLLVAYRDGTIIGATVKKQGESYFGKLPDGLLDTLNGRSGTVDLVGELEKTGATVSLTAINRAVNLSNAFALEFSSAIRAAISEISVGGEVRT